VVSVQEAANPLSHAASPGKRPAVPRFRHNTNKPVNPDPRILPGAPQADHSSMERSSPVRCASPQAAREANSPEDKLRARLCLPQAARVSEAAAANPGTASVTFQAGDVPAQEPADTGQTAAQAKPQAHASPAAAVQVEQSDTAHAAASKSHAPLQNPERQHVVMSLERALQDLEHETRRGAQSLDSTRKRSKDGSFAASLDSLAALEAEIAVQHQRLLAAGMRPQPPTSAGCGKAIFLWPNTSAARGPMQHGNVVRPR
jgi:hypothetical protein